MTPPAPSPAPPLPDRPSSHTRPERRRPAVPDLEIGPAGDPPPAASTDTVTTSIALTRRERWVVAFLGAAVFLGAFFRIPAGIQTGDSGDFQIACATLGIAHAPGYTGYALPFWIVTRLFFFLDPAYVVQLCCLACMAVGLMLGAVLLIRLGVNALVAATVALALTLYRWTWFNMLVAEVYAPSLACLTGCIYLVVEYGRRRKPWRLYAAAVLYGLLLVNRPPAICFLPGIVFAVWWIERASGGRVVLRRLATTGALSAGVVAGVLSLMLYLEKPTTTYNYLLDYAEARTGIPEDDGTFRAAAARLGWLITAQDFNYLKGSTFYQARSKLRWIRRQFFVYDTQPLLIGLLAVSLGGYVLVRRSPELAVMLGSVVVGAVAFQLQYRVHDDATDLVPVAWSLAIVMAAALARWFPRDLPPRWRTPLAVICLAGAALILRHNAVRYNPGQTRAAEAFLAEMDLASLPPDAVVASDWIMSRPVLYAKLVRTPRPDLHVVRVNEQGRWKEDVVRYVDRPVYYTQEHPAPDGFRLRPYRNIFEMVPAGGDQDTAERGDSG